MGRGWKPVGGGWGMRGRAAFRGGGNGPRIIHDLPARPVELPEEGQLSGTSDSDSDSDSSEFSSSNSDSSSDSDMDPIADAVSSKLPPPGSRNDDSGEEMGIQGITIPDKVPNTQALESSSSAFPSVRLPIHVMWRKPLTHSRVYHQPKLVACPSVQSSDVSDAAMLPHRRKHQIITSAVPLGGLCYETCWSPR
jgi:hypothetical protein